MSATSNVIFSNTDLFAEEDTIEGMYDHTFSSVFSIAYTHNLSV